NSGCTTCPLLAEKPCDVDELTVKVEYEARPEKGEKEGKTIVHELTTPIVKRKQIVRTSVPAGRTRVTRTVLPYPSLGYSINDRLAKYDFVIETMADYPVAKTAKDLKDLVSGGGEKTAKKKTKIEAKAKFSGLHCERNEHGVMRMKQLSGGGNVDVVLKKVDQASIVMAAKEFAAIPFPVLDGPYSEVDDEGTVQSGEQGASGVMFIFEFIKSIFNSMTPKEVEVIAQACGKRLKTDAKAKNGDLRGLVRIFRKDVWTIGLKVPALGEFKQEGSGKRQLLTGQTEGTFKQEGRLGRNSSGYTETNTTRGNGVTVRQTEREQWQGGRGSSLGQTTTTYGAIKKIESESKYSDRDGSEMHGYMKGGQVYGKPIREQVAERMHASHGFDFVVARNGQEVLLKETYEKVKKGIEKFAKVLADVQEAFKKAPQVGWKFTFEISAFAGQIVLEFGPKPAAALADGRYLPVNYECEGSVEIEVFNLKVALSFGIDAQVLDTGLVLKVEGSISIQVKIKFDLNLDLITKPRKEIEVEGKYVGEIKVVGYVSLVGKTVAGAELSVSAGFEFKDGKLIIDVTKPSFDLHGKLRTKPVAVSGYIKVPWWWDKKIDPPIELLPGQDLYTFK
ncbi:MAG TPA: hypothetical protein VL400_22680, partial [Polyangiaceae bacterium]|nr:hypothetical protein [Polyangiaceae bacterium]